MVVSNNSELLDDLRSMRAHGWTRNRSDKDDWKKQDNDENGDFLFVTTGFNFRPLEIQGVLGQSQLARFPEFLSRRVANAERVHEASKTSLLELIGAGPESVASKSHKGPVPHSWMTFPFKARSSDVDLDQIRRLFERFGIATRPILAGDFTLQPAFNLHGIEILGALENARAISKRSFMIGNHQSFTELQIQRICDALTSTTNLA
jgi:CDP-6-deoxy-D-xylo-4-hexulose-3-dehydrase